MGMFEKLLRGVAGSHGGGHHRSGHHGGGHGYVNAPSPMPPQVAGGGLSCSKCGAAASPGGRFCSQCGAGLIPAQCSGCSTTLALGTSFCSNCGKAR